MKLPASASMSALKQDTATINHPCLRSFMLNKKSLGNRCIGYGFAYHLCQQYMYWSLCSSFCLLWAICVCVSCLCLNQVSSGNQKTKNLTCFFFRSCGLLLLQGWALWCNSTWKHRREERKEDQGHVPAGIRRHIPGIPIKKRKHVEHTEQVLN